MSDKPKPVDSFNIMEIDSETNQTGPDLPKTPDEFEISVAISAETAKFISDAIQEAIKEYLPQLLENNRSEWLTTEDVMKVLHVSRRTLQNYRNNGKLNYFKKGRKVLFKRSEIERFLEEHTVERDSEK